MEAPMGKISPLRFSHHPPGLRPSAEQLPKAAERSHRRQRRKKEMAQTENTGFKGLKGLDRYLLL